MPGRTNTAPHKRALSPAEIDRQRLAHVATIARARALGESGNALLDKAQSLLTAHWGASSWDSREAILKTVDWLLRVALNNPQPASRSRARPIAAAPVRGDQPRHH